MFLEGVFEEGSIGKAFSQLLLVQSGYLRYGSYIVYVTSDDNFLLKVFSKLFVLGFTAAVQKSLDPGLVDSSKEPVEILRVEFQRALLHRSILCPWFPLVFDLFFLSLYSQRIVYLLRQTLSILH